MIPLTCLFAGKKAGLYSQQIEGGDAMNPNTCLCGARAVQLLRILPTMMVVAKCSNGHIFLVERLSDGVQEGNRTGAD